MAAESRQARAGAYYTWTGVSHTAACVGHGRGNGGPPASRRHTQGFSGNQHGLHAILFRSNGGAGLTVAGRAESPHSRANSPSEAVGQRPNTDPTPTTIGEHEPPSQLPSPAWSGHQAHHHRSTRGHQSTRNVQCYTWFASDMVRANARYRTADRRRRPTAPIRRSSNVQGRRQTKTRTCRGKKFNGNALGGISHPHGMHGA